MSNAVEVHNPELDPEGGKLVRQAEAPRTAVAARQGGGSIIEMMQTALERGTPIADLKEMVGLYEHMETREARRQYFEALAAFQEESQGLLKKGKLVTIARKDGGRYSYSYAPLDEIVITILPLLTKHGLSYRWDTKAERNMVTVTCTVSHFAGHSEASSMTLPSDSNNPGMSDQQKVGAAMTFGQRRSLTSALGLVSTDSELPDAQIDPTPITEDQRSQLEDMIEATGAKADKFLAFLKVESLAQLPATRFGEAMQALRDKGGRR